MVSSLILLRSLCVESLCLGVFTSYESRIHSLLYYSFQTIPGLNTSQNMLTFVDAKFTSIVYVYKIKSSCLHAMFVDNISS